MNRSWAAVAVLLQYREPTSLKIITRYIITIRLNTEKAKGFRGQSETEVLIKIYKEVYNTIIVYYFKSGDIRITLKD